MERKVIVGGLVVNSKDEFAIVQEKKPEIRGLWNLSMGGLEDHEDIIKGAKREMEEETGLKVRIYLFVRTYHNPDREGKNVIKFIYAAHPVRGKLKCPKDLLDVKWISYKDFKKIPDKKLRDSSVRMAVDDYFAGIGYPIDSVKRYS